MRLFLLLLGIGIVTMASATDKYGGEFRFAWISDLTYAIELRLYIDPDAPADMPQVTVNFGDGGSELLNVSSSVISQGNGCQALLRIFTTQHLYPGPGVYPLSAESTTRIPDIINIPGSVNRPLCVPARLVISSAGADSSPRFMTYQNNSYFNGTVFTHEPQAYDPDGDSLAFDLVVPRGQNCEPFTDYIFPDEIQSATSTMTIDPYTGVFQWSDPPIPGYASIAIRCSEWRNGTMIGQVVRDMTLCLPLSLTGITGQVARQMLVVTPSISSGQVEVEAPNGHGVIELTDMQGRCLRRIVLSPDRTVLDTHSLATGSYSLRLICDGAVSATGRFIVPQR